MIDGASLDDQRRDRGLGSDSPIDGADHAAWLAVKVGGTDVLVHDGECFELAEDLTVRFTTQWRAPFTGGGEGVLPRGTRVRVAHEPVPEAVGFAATPLNYDEIETLLVDPDDRAGDAYDGYTLVLLKREVGGPLIRVSDRHS